MGVYVGDSLVAGNVGEVYTKAQVDTMIANAVALAEPVGSIKPFAGTTVPDGYLLCDGSAISRTTYAALFAVIGTTYGTGDGSTTFNIPSTTNGIALAGTGIGQCFGTKTNGQLPNITGFINGEINFLHGTGDSYSGALYPSNDYDYQTYAEHATTYNKSRQINFDASLSSNVYVNGATQVRAASLFVAFCIKY